jgi:hypothetical protein
MKKMSWKKNAKKKIVNGIDRRVIDNPPTFAKRLDQIYNSLGAWRAVSG